MKSAERWWSWEGKETAGDKLKVAANNKNKTVATAPCVTVRDCVTARSVTRRVILVLSARGMLRVALALGGYPMVIQLQYLIGNDDSRAMGP